MNGNATIFLADDAVVFIHDVKADILAVRQFGQIEVWSANGEIHMGNMPEFAAETAIRWVVDYWKKGFFEGIKFGRDEAQAKLRKALGIAS